MHEDDIPQYWENVALQKGLKISQINNRRYLGNKYKLTDFIRSVVDRHCVNIQTVCDIFSGTGAVSSAFYDKELITNDLLYCNYIANYAWFYPESYAEQTIIEHIGYYNTIDIFTDNYVSKNFSDTFFSRENCQKIGFIREHIEQQFNNNQINFKEKSILVTSLLYAMDKIANTVGHYDAYRKNTDNSKALELFVLFPNKQVNIKNRCFNQDANQLISNVKSDLLYLDPPYNSRQYCDAYHLLENIACWQKPTVLGVARKMDRSHLKSKYCTKDAHIAFEHLIQNTDSRYILLSYNNMSNKGNERSNAKISDEAIYTILKNKGDVQVFEKSYKAFSTGKSTINDNTERLFLCTI